MTRPWTLARVRIFAVSMALTLLPACTFGELAGPPAEVFAVDGEPLVLADCTALALRRNHRDARCDPNDLKLENYPSSNQAILSCSDEDGGDALVTRTDSFTLYTLAFSSPESGRTKVEVWAAPTFPGVRTYTALVRGYVEACVLQD